MALGQVPTPYDDHALLSWLWMKRRRSLNTPDSDLSHRRQELLDGYLGYPYGDEEDGLSRVVTREMFEAVEWSMPSLTRTFLGGQSPVTYKPVNRNDELAAKQEAEYIAHLLRKTDNFYESGAQWLRSMCIYPNSYAKIWWLETTESEPAHYRGQTRIQLAMLDQNPDVRIIHAEPRMVEWQGQQVQVYDIDVRHLKPRGRLMFAPAPPEEVLIDNDASYQNLDCAEWVCHHRRCPRDELIKMGMDEETVYKLPTAELLEFSTERENRARYHDEDPHYSDDYNAMEKVDLYESYGWYDYDGDGAAEYRKMVFAGNAGKPNAGLLENVEVPVGSQPLLSLAVTAQPYRHPGVSLAEVVEEPQRVGAVLSRHMLDNAYRIMRPRTVADPDRVNIDQLEDYEASGVIEGDPSGMMAEQVPVMIKPGLELAQYWQEQTQSRTGVSRHTQGLDADVLAKSTMGAFMGAIGQASGRLEQIIRDVAETGWSGLYRKAHYLVRTHQHVPDVFELRGEWIDVNPADWKERTQIVVKVGAGTGSQHERIGSSMALLDVQREALTAGLSTPRHIYNTLDDLASAMGKSDVSRYFLDPESDEGKAWQEQQERKRQEQQRQGMQVAEMAIRPQMAETERKRLADMEDNIIALDRLNLDTQKEQNRSAEKRTELEQAGDENVPGALT